MSPRLLVMLVCLVNLVAGAGLGVAFDQRVVTKHRKWSDLPLLLKEQLDLDPEQAKKVSEIYAAHRPEYQEVMRPVRARLKAIHAESEAEIRAVLRPEQLAKYDDFKKEMQKQHADRGWSAAPVSSESLDKLSVDKKEGVH